MAAGSGGGTVNYVPGGIAIATTTKGGVWCNSPRLLELPRKTQLRTSLCLQISGICRPVDAKTILRHYRVARITLSSEIIFNLWSIVLGDSVDHNVRSVWINVRSTLFECSKNWPKALPHYVLIFMCRHREMYYYFLHLRSSCYFMP